MHSPPSATFEQQFHSTSLKDVSVFLFLCHLHELDSAGLYFNKIQCFCFEEQQLKANEEIEMPVFFFIDPEVEQDQRFADVRASCPSPSWPPLLLLHLIVTSTSCGVLHGVLIINSSKTCLSLTQVDKITLSYTFFPIEFGDTEEERAEHAAMIASLDLRSPSAAAVGAARAQAQAEPVAAPSQ